MNKQIIDLLNYVQSAPNCDQLTATVLKLAADSAALKAIKNKVPPPNDSEITFLKFSKQEVENMPDKVREYLTIKGRMLPCKEVRGMHLIRYNRDALHINIASKDLKELKFKFLKQLDEQVKGIKHKCPLIKDFADEWLSFIKPTLKESTYRSYESTWHSYIIPKFGHLRLNELTRTDIQNYLYKLTAGGKHRTAKKVKQQLGASYKIACSDYDLRNPLIKVILPRYEVSKGEAFTYTEERQIVDFCIRNKHLKGVSAILLLLYTGMRSGELKTINYVHGEYEYIDCITEKTRQGLPDKHRKIPISPMLRKVMQFIDFEKAKTISYNTLADLMKLIFPNRHLHELRYTFISRCKECNCNLELVMLWSGHTEDKDVASSKVNRGYTTYSEAFYFKEIEKVVYEI